MDYLATWPAKKIGLVEDYVCVTCLCMHVYPKTVSYYKVRLSISKEIQVYYSTKEG